MTQNIFSLHNKLEAGVGCNGLPWGSLRTSASVPVVVSVLGHKNAGHMFQTIQTPDCDEQRTFLPNAATRLSHPSHSACGWAKKCGARGLLSNTFKLRQSSTNACNSSTRYEEFVKNARYQQERVAREPCELFVLAALRCHPKCCGRSKF